MMLNIMGVRGSMKASKNVCLTMPPSLIAEVEVVAKREHRTKSELVREALRRYIDEFKWRELQSRASKRTAALGIEEGDVVRIIHEHRREEAEVKTGAEAGH